MEFPHLFLIQESFTAPRANLFCAFDHRLPNVAALEYISYLFIFFDFKFGMMMRLCNVQTTVT